MELQITKNIFDANRSYSSNNAMDSLPIINSTSSTTYNTDNYFGYDNFEILCSKNGFDSSKGNNYIQTSPKANSVESASGSISEVNLMITRLKQIDDISGKNNMCYVDGCFVVPTSACYPFLGFFENFGGWANGADNYEDITGLYNAEKSRNNFYQNDTSLIDNSYVYLGYNSNNERIIEKPFENVFMGNNTKLNRYLIGIKFKELGYTFLQKEYLDCFKTGVIEDYNFVVNNSTSGYLINSIVPPYDAGTPRTFTWYDGGKYNSYTQSIDYMTYLQSDVNNPLFMDNNFFTVYQAHNYDITSPINTATLSQWQDDGRTLSEFLGFGKINTTKTTLGNSGIFKNGTNYKYIITLNEVVYSYTRTASYDTSLEAYRTSCVSPIYDSNSNIIARSGWYVIKNVLSTSSVVYCNDMNRPSIYNYSAGNLSSDTAQISASTNPLYTVGTNTGYGIHNDTYYNKAVITLEKKDNNDWYAIARKTTNLSKTSNYNTFSETFSNLTDSSEYRWSVRLYVKNDTLWNLENKGYITSVFTSNLASRHKDGIPYYYGTYDFRVEMAIAIKNSFLMNLLYIKALQQCNGKIQLNFGFDNKYCLAPTYNIMNDISYSQDYSTMPEILTRAYTYQGNTRTLYSAYGGKFVFDSIEINYFLQSNNLGKFNLNNDIAFYCRMFGRNQSVLRLGIYQNVGCIEYYSSRDNGNTVDNNYEVNVAVLVPTENANANYDVVLVSELINTNNRENILERQMFYCSSPHGTTGYQTDMLQFSLELFNYNYQRNEKIYLNKFTSNKRGARLKFIYDEMYLGQTYSLENSWNRWNEITTYSVHFDDTVLDEVDNEFGYTSIVFNPETEATELNSIELSITEGSISSIPPFKYFVDFFSSSSLELQTTISALPTIYRDVISENGSVIDYLCPTLTTLTGNSENIIATKFLGNQFLEIRSINEPIKNTSFELNVAKSIDNSLSNDNVVAISFIATDNDDGTILYVQVSLEKEVYMDNTFAKMVVFCGMNSGAHTQTYTYSPTVNSNYFSVLIPTISEQGNSNTLTAIYKMNIDFVDCIPWNYLNDATLNYALIHKSVNASNYNENTSLYCTNLKMYKGEEKIIDYTPSTSDIANVDNVENFKPFSTHINMNTEDTHALCLLRKEFSSANSTMILPTSFGIIGYKDLVENENGDYSYTLDDCFNKSNTLYRYGLCIYDTSTKTALKTDAIYSDLVKNTCNKFLIADKTESFEFLANVSWGSLEHSSNVTYVATLNNKYPYIVDVANDNFVTGNMMLDIVNDEFLGGTGYLDAHKIQEKVDIFCNFLKKKTAKVIKDWNGRSYMIYIIPSTVESITTANNLTKLSFNFVEIGDLNNEQDLEENEVLIGDNLQDILDKYTTSN